MTTTVAEADVHVSPAAERAAAEVAASLAIVGHAIFALMQPGSLDQVGSLGAPIAPPLTDVSYAGTELAGDPGVLSAPEVSPVETIRQPAEDPVQEAAPTSAPVSTSVPMHAPVPGAVLVPGPAPAPGLAPAPDSWQLSAAEEFEGLPVPAADMPAASPVPVSGELVWDATAVPVPGELVWDATAIPVPEVLKAETVSTDDVRESWAAVAEEPEPVPDQAAELSEPAATGPVPVAAPVPAADFLRGEPVPSTEAPQPAAFSPTALDGGPVPTTEVSDGKQAPDGEVSRSELIPEVQVSEHAAVPGAVMAGEPVPCLDGALEPAAVFAGPVPSAGSPAALWPGDGRVPSAELPPAVAVPSPEVLDGETLPVARVMEGETLPVARVVEGEPEPGAEALASEEPAADVLEHEPVPAIEVSAYRAQTRFTLAMLNEIGFLDD